MKIVERSEIETLIQQTPNTPENQAVLQQLEILAQELTVVKEPYSYLMAFPALVAAAVSAPVNVLIDASAMFVVCNQTYLAHTAGAVVTSGTYLYPNVSVMLTDTGSGKNLMSASTPVPAIFGNGQFPYILPEPLLLAPNSTLQGVLTSFEAANTDTIILSFNGYKLKTLG